jgi:arsenite methyltransferase
MNTSDVNEAIRQKYGQAAVRGHVPPEIKKSLELWAGCAAGALSEEEYREKLAQAGFDQVNIEATRVYNIDDARTFLSNRGTDVDNLAGQVGGKFISAFVRATKPVAVCCASSCCS